MSRRSVAARIAALVLGVGLAACGAAAPAPTAPQASAAPKPAATAAPAAPAPAATSAPQKPTEAAKPAQGSTTAPAGTLTGPAAAGPATAPPTDTGAFRATPTAPQPAATVAAPRETNADKATSAAEPRTIELEWPPDMRMGDSNIVRITLEPVSDGYVTNVQIEGNRVETRTISVTRPAGYSLAAVARLDGIGFEIDPRGEWQKDLPAREFVTWQWTIQPRERGRHTLSASVALAWTAEPGSGLPARDRAQIFSRAREVIVSDAGGIPVSAAAVAGLVALVVGGLCAAVLFARRRPGNTGLPRPAKPNENLALETQAGIQLDPARAALLRAVFAPYQRVVVEGEFRSGYSGARAFLAVPIKPDGRADAHAIVKIGDATAIGREYDNYARFVKDTLPPVTARIQEPPVAVEPRSGSLAALRYTFVGAGGVRPISLREALLANPDPALLRQLFDTFGPTWWMQRHARTFTCAQEYDRALPAHLVVAAAPGTVGARGVDGRRAEPPGLARGEQVTLSHFARIERRADSESWSLIGAGSPPLRVRVLGARAAAPSLPGAYQIVDTRLAFLREAAGEGELFGLPEPLEMLPRLLDRTVRGSQSIIHGDLNLENALVGPGGAVWLIDFAETREGHPLADFAHLYADVIAHIVAPQVTSPREALEAMVSHRGPAWLALLQTIDGMAGRCLYDPADHNEWALARGMVCLGALKFANLSAAQKRLLYLTAALAWSELH